MKDNVKFVGEFVGNLEGVRAWNKAIHEIYDDVHVQIDPTAIWGATNDYGAVYSHVLRNNTPYYYGISFIYYIYTGDERLYLGESGYSINEIPPWTNYKVIMNESDFENGVRFYIDWTITDIKQD